MGLTDYIRDTRGELKHVSWPTRKQAIVFTLLTIVLSIALSFYLGLFDFIFSLGIEKIVAK
jgi:preprotein translocase subunit SecE